MKKINRIIAILLTFIFLVSLIGCKKTSDDFSSGDVQVIVEEEYVYVGDNSETNDESKEENSSLVSSDDPNIITPPPPEIIDYGGTTVKFAVTSDPMKSEKAPVIENFQKKYRITIEPVIINGDFATELCGLIQAGKSPDITRSSGEFPLALSYLQSLDAAKLDYDDPIWEQGMFDMTTFYGSPYLCMTDANVYAETDIVIYRKDILNSIGCKTPEEYDSEGKWNLDAFFEIARKCSSEISSVKGCSFVNYDSALHMTGNAVFKLENGKFVNGITNTAVDALSKLSDAINEGIVSTNATKGIVDGTVAITTHHSYALRQTGAYENNREVWDKLGFYYLPTCDESKPDLKTGIFRGWGLVKGASNPVAAGLFLRYYLDSSNFDFDNFYISSDARKFFMKATDIDYDNWYPYYTYGNKHEDITGIDFFDDIYSVAKMSESNIIKKIESINSKIDDGCKKLNDFVSLEIHKN